MDDDDFVTRDYQSELADIATRQNSILYLPTGSGKTYISILVIKRFLHELQHSLKDGGKIIAIVVNKVPLVEQTARVMSRHLPVDQIGYYCGAMGVDEMTKEEWHLEFDQYRVVCMTVQILVDIIRGNKLRVDQLAVLVLDECHHAVGKDAMAQLMELVRRTPVNSQPRILGMSATLLNNELKLHEVDSAIRQLEATLSAKVITSYKQDVARYSTKAQIRFELFSEDTYSAAVVEANRELSHIYFDGKFEVKKPSLLHTDDFFHPLFSYKNSVKFPSLKKDIEKCIQDIGVYGGSKIALNITCMLERIVLLTDDGNTLYALKRLICDLTAFREKLSARIHQQEGNIVLKNSSPKLQTLVKLLKEFYDVHVANSKTDDSKFCAIVFVQERLTAKILWAVLADLSTKEEYGFLRPEFVVGTRAADPREDIRSSILSIEWNSEVLRRFSVGAVNVLISSNVLEEGIDVSDCNVVICYDTLKSYRSYIQAQGRARHEKSTFVVMLPCGQDQYTLKSKMEEWEQQRKRVNEFVGSTVNEKVRTYVDPDEDTLPPYITPSGAMLDVVAALPVLNRYCIYLSRLEYFSVSPFCKVTSAMDKTIMKSRIELRMPLPCPLRTPVQGLPARTVKGAKRLAAFELCKRLHEIDELNDSLHPKRESKLLHLPKLFPNWCPTFSQEPLSKSFMHLEGFPECLSDGLQEGQEVFVHVIKIEPTSARPQAGDFRRTVYYDMFVSSYDFAIISAKKVPKVCDFPLFVPGVDLKVHLVPSEQPIKLSSEEWEALFTFHANLFLGPVPVVQPHVMLDRSLDKNAFLIAPVNTDGNNVEIQWDFVRTYTEFPDVYIDDTTRKETEINPKDYVNAVIKPWYRSQLPYEVYLVTEVCEDMDATSAFPSTEFDTFDDYFKEKYYLEVYHKSAPLLEVRHFITKIIALTPRVETKKKRWDKDNEEVREHMVPELCGRLNFPAILWLKATLLPSALHRLERLFICRELTERIAREAVTGCVDNDVILKELVVDPSTLQVKDKKEFVLISTKHGMGKGSIKLNELRQSFESRKPWGNEQEPVDISRSLDSLNIMEVAFYDQFVSKNNGVIENPKKKKTRTKFTLPDVADGEGEIRLLAESQNAVGPTISDIFQATTAKSAREIQHYESLLNLGRSVLHLAAHVYLFFSYASLPARKLQWVASKLTSDHNIALCGLAKKLQNLAKIQEFGCETWDPPFFKVPELIAHAVIESEVPSSVLNSVNFSPEEQRSGVMRPESRSNILELLQESKRDDAIFGEYERTNLGYQAITIEDLSACVTALIGMYFKTNGLEGALKVISWFQLLPNDSVGLIMDDIKIDDHKSYPNVNAHLRCVSTLEDKLRYKFRNRSYLLDALTHDSYIDADNEGQDRLSAVGYAILDFLITIYVSERFCDRPTEEQDALRAALTNRLTFSGLLVRYDIHKYILSSSTRLVDVIDTFVQYQDEREHVIDQETFLQITDYEISFNEKAEVPAVLAHTFSALVGAVYLDTRCDLNQTWRFVYRLLKNEIGSFSQKIPLQPKDLLKELTPTPSFTKFETNLDPATGRYYTICQINTNGLRKEVQASGRTADEAENHAAKKGVNLLIFSSDER